MECPLAIIAGGRPVKQVCDVLGVARSNVSVRRSCPVGWQDGRCVGRTDDAELVAELREAVVDLPSYGFRRVWGVIRNNQEMHGEHQAQLPSHARSRPVAAAAAKASLHHPATRRTCCSDQKQSTLGAPMASSSGVRTASHCALRLHWIVVNVRPCAGSQPQVATPATMFVT